MALKKCGESVLQIEMIIYAFKKLWTFAEATDQKKLFNTIFLLYQAISKPATGNIFQCFYLHI